jgi:hypothetical protein
MSHFDYSKRLRAGWQPTCAAASGAGASGASVGSALLAKTSEFAALVDSGRWSAQGNAFCSIAGTLYILGDYRGIPAVRVRKGPSLASARRSTDM